MSLCPRCLSVWCLALSLVALAGLARAERSWTDLAYGADPAQTLDLYLPEQFHEGKQLLVFVESTWWSTPEEPLLNEPLVRFWNSLGLAAARVRHRSGDRHPHPAQVQDLAAAVSFLRDKAAKYGYRKDRIFVLGHGSGGHLVSLLALDDRYLKARGLKPMDLAGVVSLSGVYDLNPGYDIYEGQRRRYEQVFGRDAEARRNASPIRYTDREGAPFLVLSAEADATRFAVEARRFAEALEEGGNTYVFQRIIPGRTHSSLRELARPGNPASFIVLDFVGVEGMPPRLSRLLAYENLWRDPPLSSAGFWEQAELVQTYPVDARLRNTVSRVLGDDGYRLEEWALETYQAVDLFQYLRVTGKDQGLQAGYLVTTNARGEQLYWDLHRIAPFEPVVVVGLDGKRELFRLATFYQLNQAYSWKPDEQAPPLMVRPLGAFLFFRRPPPPELRPAFLGQYALVPDSLTVVRADPLAPLRDLPPPLRALMIEDNACASCHQFRGVGAKAHHIRARDGKPGPGYALALESYPAEVWERFIYEPLRVAKAIGSPHQPVPQGLREALFELVEQAR